LKRLFAALILSLALEAQAQDRSEGLGFLSGARDGARYAFSVTPAEPGAPFIAEHHAGGSIVVLRRSSDTWSLNGRASRTELSWSPVVAQTGLVVPAKLWEFQGGGAFSRRLDDRKSWGVSAGLGSASDEPFGSLDNAEAKVTAYREFPGRARDSWMLFLAYSNNRTFWNGVPLPGAAYAFREPVPGLQAVIGLPFLWLSYQLDKDSRASFSLFGPTHLSVEGARRLFRRVWGYSRFERSPEQWLRADRAERRDRLIFDHQQARVGVRVEAGEGFSLDLSAGRDLRRRFYESRDASRSSVPRVELPDAWTGSLALSWRG